MNDKGEGVGQWYSQRPQLWNLMWVLFPALDSYVNGTETIIPFSEIGLVLGRVENDTELLQLLRVKPTQKLVNKLEMISKSLNLDTNIKQRLQHYLPYHNNVVDLSSRRRNKN